MNNNNIEDHCRIDELMNEFLLSDSQGKRQNDKTTRQCRYFTMVHVYQWYMCTPMVRTMVLEDHGTLCTMEGDRQHRGHHALRHALQHKLGVTHAACLRPLQRLPHQPHLTSHAHCIAIRTSVLAVLARLEGLQNVACGFAHVYGAASTHRL